MLIKSSQQVIPTGFSFTYQLLNAKMAIFNISNFRISFFRNSWCAVRSSQRQGTALSLFPCLCFLVYVSLSMFPCLCFLLSMFPFRFIHVDKAMPCLYCIVYQISIFLLSNCLNSFRSWCLVRNSQRQGTALSKMPCLCFLVFVSLSLLPYFHSLVYYQKTYLKFVSYKH